MIIFLFILIIMLGIFIFILPRLITIWYTSNQMYENISEVPSKPVAIVFGAGLWRDGSPTPVLRDRVATAAELYFDGKVEKILMSGDNRFENYNEPAAMREYALQLNVPDEAIVLDYAGRRTYDTCYRARDIFKVKRAVLVTQKFHLPRAIYICDILGVQSIGVTADRRDYRESSLLFWNLREFPAALVALWEVHISKPLPVLGNPEPIFPLEAQ